MIQTGIILEDKEKLPLMLNLMLYFDHFLDYGHQFRKSKSLPALRMLDLSLLLTSCKYN